MEVFTFVAATGVSAFIAYGGNPQRIGHTTLLPRNSNPDDSGLYNAFMDPTNGYAYFLGSYLFQIEHLQFSTGAGGPANVCLLRFAFTPL